MKKVSESLLYDLIGDRIRDIRNQDGGQFERLTQSELADLVGIKRTSVTNVELGNQKAPLHFIYEICAQLNLQISDILPSLQEVLDKAPYTITSSENIASQFGDKTEKVESDVERFVKRVK